MPKSPYWQALKMGDPAQRIAPTGQNTFCGSVFYKALAPMGQNTFCGSIFYKALAPMGQNTFCRPIFYKALASRLWRDKLERGKMSFAIKFWLPGGPGILLPLPSLYFVFFWILYSVSCILYSPFFSSCILYSFLFVNLLPWSNKLPRRLFYLLPLSFSLPIPFSSSAVRC